MDCECVEEKLYGSLAKGIKIFFSTKVQKDLNLSYSVVLKSQGMGIKNKILKINKPNIKSLSKFSKKHKIDPFNIAKLLYFND